MAERTLAEAVANLRLRDTKFNEDLANIRRRLSTAVEQMEADARVRVGVVLDEDQTLEAFGLLESMAVDLAPTARLRIDADSALGEITALRDISTDPLVLGVKLNDNDVAAALGDLVGRADNLQPTVNVGVNIDSALGEIGSLYNAVNDPLVLPVQVDPDQANGAVKSISVVAGQTLAEGMGRAGDSAGESFGQHIGKTLNGVVGTIGAVAGGFVATSLVKGFARLTVIQDSTAALTVALGSAAKAGELLDKVLGVVRGTPFNLDQFANAAANMVAFGIEAKKVPGYLTAIGEASASRGSRANEFAQRLSTEFGQITTQGKITGDSLLTLQESGVNALVILGNAAGKTTAEMSDLVSKGAVPAKFALEALTQGITKGSTGIAGSTNAFAGTMAKLRETLTGAIGGFSAATARFGVSLIQPLVKILVAGFGSLSAVLDTLGAKVKEAFAKIGDSPLFEKLKDFFTELPSKIGPTLDKLKEFGSVLAPLGAVIGAAGFGKIKEVLGPLQGLIPQVLTNPLVGATLAFALFTPEVRDKLLPVVAKLGEIFAKLAGTLVVVGSKIIDAATPAILRLVEVADQMVPVVQAGADFAAALAFTLVPVLTVFGQVLKAIPLPVLAGLVTAFVALKAVQGAVEPIQRVSAAFDKFFDGTGTKMTSTQKAVTAGALSMSAAMGGLAVASEDSTTKVIGAVTAAGSIALAFATTGPIGGAIATVGAVLGFIAGGFVEDAKKAQELKAHTEYLGTALANATTELLKHKEALQQVAENATAATVAVSALGAAILNEKGVGDDIAKALVAFKLPASGELGYKAIIDVIKQIKAAGGDLNQVGVIMDGLTAKFGANAPELANLIEQTKDLDELQKTLEGFGAATPEEFTRFASDLGVPPEMMGQLVDLVQLNKDGKITAEQWAAVYNTFTLKTAEGANDLIAGTQKAIELGTERSENYRVAIELAERDSATQAKLIPGQVALTRLSKDQLELTQLQNNADKILAEDQDRIFEERINQALAFHGMTHQQILDANALADAQHRSILSLGLLPADETKAFQAEIKKWHDEMNGVTDAAEAIVPPIFEADEALKDSSVAAAWLANQIRLSEEAANAVSSSIDRLLGKLSGATATQDFAKDLRDIGVGLGKIINESDLKKGESLLKDIDSQRERIQELQVATNQAYEDAKAKIPGLEDQMARAKAVGAVEGAAAIQRELDHIYDAANKKSGELRKAQGEIGKKEAERAALNLVPTSALDQLLQQAKDRGLSMFDLLVSAPTDESKAAFETLVSKQIQDAFGLIQTEIDKGNNIGALNLIPQLRDQLLWSLVGGGFDPVTARALVDKYFQTADLEKGISENITAAATAAAAAVAKDLLPSLSPEEGGDGSFHEAWIKGAGDLPVTLKVDHDAWAVARETLLAEQANTAALTAELTVTPPDTVEYLLIQAELQRSIDKVDSLKLKARIDALSDHPTGNGLLGLVDDPKFTELMLQPLKAKLALVSPTSQEAETVRGQIEGVLASEEQVKVDLFLGLDKGNVYQVAQFKRDVAALLANPIGQALVLVPPDGVDMETAVKEMQGLVNLEGSLRAKLALEIPDSPEWLADQEALQTTIDTANSLRAKMLLEVPGSEEWLADQDALQTTIDAENSLGVGLAVTLDGTSYQSIIDGLLEHPLSQPVALVPEKKHLTTEHDVFGLSSPDWELSVPISLTADVPAAMAETQRLVTLQAEHTKLAAKLNLATPGTDEYILIDRDLQAVITEENKLTASIALTANKDAYESAVAEITATPIIQGVTLKPIALTNAQVAAAFGVGTPLNPVQLTIAAAPTTTPTIGVQGPLKKDSTIRVLREGGFFPAEDHQAHIAAPGAWRVFAEPETGGEGYIPLAPHKRGRSTQILTAIADMFGLDVMPREPLRLPEAIGPQGPGLSDRDADRLGRAIARHTKLSPVEHARQVAERYDRSVNIAPGGIVVQENTPRQTARRLVSELADLSLGRH